MNALDIIAGLILLVSALIGFARGAVREVVALAAFGVAALAAVYLLPVSGPLARHVVHPRWVGTLVAVVAVFAAIYLAVRVAGGSLSAALRRQATLGMLDRASGLGLGFVRGLGVLGGAWLAVHSVMPQLLDTPWVSQSLLYPLSRGAGRTLAAAAPGGLRASAGIERLMSDRMAQSGSQDSAANGIESGASATPADEDAAPYGRSSGRRVKHRAHLAVVTGDPAQE